jgi:hypothetical protein
MQGQPTLQLSALIILASMDQAGSSAATAEVCITPSAAAMRVKIVFTVSFL